jgi:hypothetical protein
MNLQRSATYHQVSKLPGTCLDQGHAAIFPEGSQGGEGHATCGWQQESRQETGEVHTFFKILLHAGFLDPSTLDAWSKSAMIAISMEGGILLSCKRGERSGMW